MLEACYLLVRRLVDLMLLRLGPQDMPPGSNFVWITGTATLIVSTVGQWLFGDAIWLAAVNVLILYVFARIALQLAGHPERHDQTVTALFGTDALLTAALLPITYPAVRAVEAGNDPAAFISLALLGALIWWVAILAHILRHALEIRLLASSALAIGYLFGNIMLVNLLSPLAGSG